MEQETTPKNESSKKKHWFRLFCKYFFIFLIVFLISISAGLYWLSQTGSGQAWLLTTINKFLKSDPAKPGPQFILTSLSGSLPFNFKFGLEAYDGYGLWLSAPENTFILNWRELPGKIHLSELKISNADFSRVPVLPDEPETSPPSKPFTIEDFQKLLEETGDFLYQSHWWLPDLLIENTGIENFSLPAALVSPSADASKKLAVDANLKAEFVNQSLNLRSNAKVRSNNNVIEIEPLSLENAQVNLQLALKPEPDNKELTALAQINMEAYRPELKLQDFPEDFLGEKLLLSLNLNASAITDPEKKSFKLDLVGPELTAGAISSSGTINWQSGSGWPNGIIDGPEKINLNLNYTPVALNWLKSHKDSPLAMLPDPVKLIISANGNLPKTDFAIDLATSEIEVSGKEISDLHFLVKGEDLALPLNKFSMQALQEEHQINVSLSAIAEKIPVKFLSQIFFQTMPDSNGKKPENSSGEDLSNATWLVGLRNLSVTGGGLQGSGNVAAVMHPDNKPELDGSLHFRVDNWETINKFLPEMAISGLADLQIELSEGQNAQSEPSASWKPSLPRKNTGQQHAMVHINVPRLNLDMGKDKFSINRLQSSINLNNIYEDPELKCDLAADKIEAAGFKISTKINAAGKLSGSINASIITTGNIKTNIEASWKPGEAHIRNLRLDLNLPASFSPSGKAVQIAINSRQPVLAEYGDKKVSVQGLNLEIQPSGNLKSNATFSPDKLDCNIQLDNFNLKPWQKLLPQLPAGTVNLQANLSGSPKKPAGNFNLQVNKLVVPKASLPPVSVALKGNVINQGSASALQIALAIDPSTLKALGGTAGNVTASVPLIFAENGLPQPNMNGNMAAKIRWDGALGPLWNLVPVADMRLNGRVNVDIDATGSLKKPQIKGGLYVNKARFEEVALGVLLTDINLKLELKDKLPGMHAAKGKIDNLPGGAILAFSASDGRGGTVKLDGQAALSGDYIEMATKINHLKPLRRRDIHIELSGDATVRGSAMAPVINGEIIVNQGEVLLNNIEMTGSVTTLPITESGTKKTEEKSSAANVSQGSGSLNVRVRMLPRFTVEGRGLTSIWQANLLIEGTLQNPRITGNISSVKGNFDFLGKNFALTKGIVFFGGGQISNPLLDIELTNETPDLTAHILVTGPVNKIKLSMTSDPSLPRDEILSRVLFGRSVGDLSRMEALQLAGAVAQLAGFGGGTGILGMAKKALGVDVLRLGTSASNAAGEPGDQTAGGTTIEMGKYINDMIYVGVQQGMQPDSTTFIIQLELTPRTNLEIRSEQNNTWGGLQWKYNY